MEKNIYNGMQFDKLQMAQIEVGLRDGLEVSWYAKPEFSWGAMQQIRAGLEQGVDVSVYANKNLSAAQMYEIREGLKNGVDVSLYAKVDYWGDQMEMIRKGLEEELDVSFYTDHRFGSDQMFQILDGLRSGIDVSVYADPEFSSTEMGEIKKGLEQGLDAAIYADPRFARVQMEEIRIGLEQGVNAKAYANPKLDAFQMRDIREALKKEMEAIAKGGLSETTAMAEARLLIDMDGTLAKFKTVNTMESLYEEGYFLDLEPMQNVIDAVKLIIQQQPELPVYIISSVLSDSKYAMMEKNKWLDKYLPEISIENRFFPPCGENKLEYAPGGIRINDYLLDDYTQNLNQWEPPAKGIKLLNGINHTNESWQGNMLRYDKEPEELARNIIDIMSKKVQIMDLKP